MKEITPQEAKARIDELGPHTNSMYDFTDEPIFPDTRRDVCAVRRMAENGSDYGFDTLYLLWRAGEEIQCEELANSKLTQDYIHLDKILEDRENIVVRFGSHGSNSGSPWTRGHVRRKKDLGLN